MRRYATVGEAVAFAKKHGAEVSDVFNIVVFKKPVGLKVFGCGDFLRSHGYLVSYK